MYTHILVLCVKLLLKLLFSLRARLRRPVLGGGFRFRELQAPRQELCPDFFCRFVFYVICMYVCYLINVCYFQFVYVYFPESSPLRSGILVRRLAV